MRVNSVNKIYFSCLIVGFLGMLLASGCKPDPKLITTEKLDETVTSYRFEPGSYWIYGVVGDTLEDSISINSVNRGDFRFDADETTEEVWDYYRTEFHSSLRDLDYYEVISQDNIRRGAGDADSTRLGGELLFSGSLIEGELIYSWDGWSLEAGGEVENLQAGPTTWPTAHKFISYEPDNPVDGRDILYFVDEVGIVRMEKNVADSTQSTWNLLRYRTVQFE